MATDVELGRLRRRLPARSRRALDQASDRRVGVGHRRRAPALGSRACEYRGGVRRSRIANLPIRVATGAFILSSGLSKLQADKDTYERLHERASGTFPILENVPSEQFGKALAATEVGLGAALLMPFVVGDGLAGLMLSAFSTGLLRLYLKTPGMRQEGSLRPSRDGTAMAKDVWLEGIGLSLLASSIGTRPRGARRAKKRSTNGKAIKAAN